MNHIMNICSARLSRFYSFALFFLLIGSQSAFAHARLIKSNPSNTERLEMSPARIDLWFNELLDDGFNSIEVFPLDELNQPKRTNFAMGNPAVDPKDRTHLSIAVEPLKPGSYIVSYRVLSRDGHTAPGRISFHVAPATAPKSEGH